MSLESFVGVDVGGGGIRVRARIGDRDVSLRRREPVPRRSGRIDVAVLAARISELLGAAEGGAPRVRRLAVGMTGMPELLDPGELADALHELVACDSVVISSDALTTHLGALQGRPGTIVAAGTGVIACATDHAGTWVRAGGWGHLVGDEGGGAWIGAEAIRAALRRADGRPEGSAALLAALEERWGDPRAAVAHVYGSRSPVHELAAFAPASAEAARAGDPVALGIWRSAGEQLAQLAVAAGRGLPPVYSWGGRLFDAGELLVEPLRDAILREQPGAELIPPAGQSADGALRLAERGLGAASEAFAPDAVEYPVVAVAG